MNLKTAGEAPDWRSAREGNLRAKIPHGKSSRLRPHSHPRVVAAAEAGRAVEERDERIQTELIRRILQGITLNSLGIRLP